MNAAAPALAGARVRAPVLAVLLVLLAAAAVAVTAFALARGVPAGHHLGMLYDHPRSKMLYD